MVFTTPNVADTKHAMVKLHYEGPEVAAWRLLEEDDPDLGQKERGDASPCGRRSICSGGLFGSHDSLVLAALRWASRRVQVGLSDNDAFR